MFVALSNGFCFFFLVLKLNSYGSIHFHIWHRGARDLQPELSCFYAAHWIFLLFCSAVVVLTGRWSKAPFSPHCHPHHPFSVDNLVSYLTEEIGVSTTTSLRKSYVQWDRPILHYVLHFPSHPTSHRCFSWLFLSPVSWTYSSPIVPFHQPFQLPQSWEIRESQEDNFPWPDYYSSPDSIISPYFYNKFYWKSFLCSVSTTSSSVHISNHPKQAFSTILRVFLPSQTMSSLLLKPILLRTLQFLPYLTSWKQ